MEAPIKQKSKVSWKALKEGYVCRFNLKRTGILKQRSQSDACYHLYLYNDDNVSLSEKRSYI